MKTLIAISAVAVVALSAASAPSALSAIPVMILDGESGGPYHKWPLVTQVLKKELDETNLFQVDVVSAPAATGELRDFQPAFDKYRAVVFNYDAPDERWPAALKTSFERYISNGGGLVSVHAADNAFPGWKAFNEMIGIGGWRDRNENAGPYWYFKGGKLVSDTSPGAAGSHGNRLPFLMTVRNPNHPITHGLPPTWMHQGDELYAKLRGPGRNMDVLATAYSDPANNGTGRDEPLLMALSYGKGRIFHTTLGHDVNGLSSVDFVVTFQRGTEWAATGSVTQKVPANFPTATAVSYRSDLAAMDPANKVGMNAFDVAAQRTAAAPVPAAAPASSAQASPEQLKAGEATFGARCGFCHGRDAAGGESGPDLTRAAVVANDVNGDKLAPVIRSGRPDRGMPAFTLSDADLASVVAFIHDQKRKADLHPGSRRSVDVADLQTGNAEAGRAYFNGNGGCAKCHAPDGDLKGIAMRSQGLALLRRMLYPRSEGGRGEARTRGAATATVTVPSGEVVTGRLAYRDEFTIAVMDASGRYRSWPASQVKFTVDDPLQAHAEQLAKYTDDDIHNVLAYLQTLR